MVIPTKIDYIEGYTHTTAFYRDRDFSETFSFWTYNASTNEYDTKMDLDSYSAKATCRESRDPSSAKLFDFTISLSVGSGLAYVSDITWSVARATLAAVTQDYGYYDITLTAGGLSWPYQYGKIQFLDMPTVP